MADNPFLKGGGGDVNPFAPTTAQGGVASTFSRYGKLSLRSVIACTRCGNDHTPKSEHIRQHNRSHLIRLLCPGCTARNNELVAASVSLMIAKGGFPPSVDQLLGAFYRRDQALDKGTEDPFEDIRVKYLDDPLQEEDIGYWIGEKLYSFNRANNQLECLIDRVLDDPDRAILLGKAGIEGKHMASRRASRQAGEKAGGNPQL